MTKFDRGQALPILAVFSRYKRFFDAAFLTHNNIVQDIFFTFTRDNNLP